MLYSLITEGHAKQLEINENKNIFFVIQIHGSCELMGPLEVHRHPLPRLKTPISCEWIVHFYSSVSICITYSNDLMSFIYLGTGRMGKKLLVICMTVGRFTVCNTMSSLSLAQLSYGHSLKSPFLSIAKGPSVMRNLRQTLLALN